jgi:hypothetical protein
VPASMIATRRGARDRRAGRLLSVPAMVLLCCLAACSGGPVQPTPPPAPAASSPNTPSASSASWTERCTSQVTYWAGELLSGRDGGYDYQEMGLSGTTNEALHAVLASPDRTNTAEWIRSEAARQCEARAAAAARHASSPGTGWPQ